MEWKTALEEALENAPSAAMGQNGILKNDQLDAADAADTADVPLEQCKFFIYIAKFHFC